MEWEPGLGEIGLARRRTCLGLLMGEEENL